MTEKWNKRLYFRNEAGLTPEEEIHARDAAKIHTPEIYTGVELEKNAFEKEAIASVNRALAHFLKYLHLPHLEVPESNVHVIPDEEFDAEFASEPEIAGATAYGHCYIRRNNEPIPYIHVLSHEIAHAAAFHAVHVQETIEMQTWKNARSGTHVMKKNGSKGTDAFHGLNEATTEMVAQCLREIMVQVTGVPSAVEHNSEIATGRKYHTNITVVERIAMAMSNEDEKAYSETINSLFTDHFKGTFTFTKQMERWRKGSVKILSAMEGNKASALQTLVALDLDDN